MALALITEHDPCPHLCSFSTNTCRLLAHPTVHGLRPYVSWSSLDAAVCCRLSMNMFFLFRAGGTIRSYRPISDSERAWRLTRYQRYTCNSESAQKNAFSALFSEAWVNIAARVFLWSRPWKQRLFPSRELMSLNMSDRRLPLALVQHHLLSKEGKVLAAKLYGYTNTKYLQNKNNVPK